MKNRLLLLFVFSALFSYAQPFVKQLTTVVPTNELLSSYPQNLTVFKNKILFTATKDGIGHELWISDGTSEGTSLLKDVVPGSAHSGIQKLVIMKDKVYFFAYVNNSYQLWATDGTTAGTKYVYAPGFAAVDQITSDGNFLYFLNKDQDVLELWKSDGTSTGTVSVKKDIKIWNDPKNLVVAGGLIYFTCQLYQANDSRVWRSDGTTSGTFPITEELNVDASSGGTTNSNLFLEYKGKLYFIAITQKLSPSVGLVQCDGSATTYVKGMQEGYVDIISYGKGIVYNDKMYFSFFDAENTRLSIWQSDGTAANTIKIYEKAFSNYFAPSPLFGRGNSLYFTEGGATSGTYLSKIDLTTKTVQSLKQLTSETTKPFIFVQSAHVNLIVGSATGNFYVGAIKTSYPWDLWTSDGTVSGTLQMGTTKVNNAYAMLDNKMYFGGSTGTEFELWSSGGTVANTTVLKTINPGVTGMFSTQPIAVGNKAVFRARENTNGSEPWVSDGTVAGTHMLKNLSPGQSASFPDAFTEWNGQIVFTAAVGNNYSIFTTDGNEANTVALVAMPAHVYPMMLKKNSDETVLYILAEEPDGTNTIYKILKNESSLQRVKNFRKNSSDVPFSVLEWAVAGSTLYMLVYAEGTDLWKSDGTASGTDKVLDHYDARDLTVVDDAVYYVATKNNEDKQNQIVQTNDIGSLIIKDFTGTTSYDPRGLTALGRKLLFSINDKILGREMWISDGTIDGTRIVKDIFTGIGGINIQSPVVLDQSMYFVGDNEITGSELWKTDGTEHGTVIVKDIVPGPGGSAPQSIRAINNKLYFSAYTEATGTELWTSDGTESNTKLLADVFPGAEGSTSRNFCAAGSRLLFFARTVSDGSQLWSYSDTDPEPVTGLGKDSNLFSVFPNPSRGVFHITINDSNMAGGKIEVLSSEGRRVSAEIYSAGEHTIDLTDASPGMYLIRFVNDRKTFITKVVKM